MRKFDHVVILSDGIRGHFHQSLGIARCVCKISGAKLEGEIIIPKLSSVKRFFVKLAARKNRLNLDLDNEIFARVRDFKNTLFISTGSSAAPYNISLARTTGNFCAVVMTPSILGTDPFDFAIVPEHDKHDSKAGNIFVTLGAPNHIDIQDLHEQAVAKFGNVNRERNHKVIALLIGGNDANYGISPEFAAGIFANLREFRDCEFLITTSRRTGEATDKAVKNIFGNCDNVAYMLLASENPDENPVPAMLGAASHVLVTEDSVSMVSESITAGFRVGLIRVERKTGFLKNALGFGAKRFDELFAEFSAMNLLEDLGDNPDFGKFLSAASQKHDSDFNEAMRAAKWILDLE